MNKINFAVKKLEKRWRTVDMNNRHDFTIRVKKGDEISLSAQGSDASFQFPDSTLFIGGIYYFRLNDGESRTLQVAPDAPTGAHTYAVFIHTDKVFAKGESPPKIIIRE